MSALLSAVRAQVAAEVAMRLRSPATIVAVVFLIALSWMWFPPAAGKAASLSWETADGLLFSPEANAAALGLGVALLLSVFFVLAAFYLIVGSLQRDRRLRIGLIIAATPSTKLAFLAGRFFGHVCYLAALSLVAFVVGLAAFVHRGIGPFDVGAFLAPSLLVLPGGLLIIPALTLCFETLPILRSRAGLVLWFLLGVPLLFGVPMMVSGLPTDKAPELPFVDPIGAATLQVLAAKSLPQAVPGTIASGLVIHNTAPTRVPWDGVKLSPQIVLTRLFSAMLIAAIPFVIAVLLFDRFDPARSRPPGPAKARRQSAAVAGPDSSPASLHYSDLPTITAHPEQRWRAVLAESRLILLSLGKWRFVLLAGAIAPVFFPPASQPAAALAYLLVLALAIADVGARESLFGAGPLVLSQPGVPNSAILWKLAACSIVTIGCGLPILFLQAFHSPVSALSLLCGLLSLAAASVALSAMSGGSKLFLALMTVLVYLAVQSFPPADFSGVMGAPLHIPLTYLLASAALIGIGVWRERAL